MVRIIAAGRPGVNQWGTRKIIISSPHYNPTRFLKNGEMKTLMFLCHIALLSFHWTL